MTIWHYLRADLATIAARPVEPAGNRRHRDADGTSWLPQFEAAEAAGVKSVVLWRWRKNRWCSYLGRAIAAKSVALSHGPRVWMYLEKDVTEVRRRREGWTDEMMTAAETTANNGKREPGRPGISGKDEAKRYAALEDWARAKGKSDEEFEDWCKRTNHNRKTVLGWMSWAANRKKRNKNRFNKTPRQ